MRWRTHLPPFRIDGEAINCHHNYVAVEQHFGEKLFITRKGAISAREGQLGIIPGSMGAQVVHRARQGQSRIVLLVLARRGPAHEPHGGQAALQPVRSGASRPKASSAARTAASSTRSQRAYKDIDEVMANQTDLVEVGAHAEAGDVHQRLIVGSVVKSRQAVARIGRKAAGRMNRGIHRLLRQPI